MYDGTTHYTSMIKYVYMYICIDSCICLYIVSDYTFKL